MSRYRFLVDTYETERLKVLGIWSMFRDEDLPVRPHGTDPRGRSVHEQMVHQCVSEDLWFRTMLGIDVGDPPRSSPRSNASCSIGSSSGRSLRPGWRCSTSSRGGTTLTDGTSPSGKSPRSTMNEPMAP